ncbi:hypothetical protein [Kitasatospora sp. NPDC094016]|uniref:hypothetical protein n=1 Tax=Kitasatospora sp. NPDC094016 TaxID=3154986 RepID=UPI0033213575
MHEEYALTSGWTVALTVVDDEMEKPPERRPMFLAGLQMIKGNGAGAILIPSGAAVSPIEGEFDEFSRRVEKAGGFIQVTRR